MFYCALSFLTPFGLCVYLAFSMRIREHGCHCSEMAVLVQHGVNLMTVKVGDGENTSIFKQYYLNIVYIDRTISVETIVCEIIWIVCSRFTLHGAMHPTTIPDRVVLHFSKHHPYVLKQLVTRNHVLSRI